MTTFAECLNDTSAMLADCMTARQEKFSEGEYQF